MHLHVQNNSPLELPSGCRGAMEEQARQIFLEEERAETENNSLKCSQEAHPPRQPRHVGDSPKSGPSPEIPLPGKTMAGGTIPEEFPY